MFAYICVALGKYSTDGFKMWVEAKITVGLMGVLVVLASVGCAVGLFGYLRVAATLIILEVVPFLVLAVGVDNMFILIQANQVSSNTDS